MFVTNTAVSSDSSSDSASILRHSLSRCSAVFAVPLLDFGIKSTLSRSRTNEDTDCILH